MTVKSVVRGVTVGATVGTVCYMMSKATSKQKHDIRKMPVRQSKLLVVFWTISLL